MTIGRVLAQCWEEQIAPVIKLGINRNAFIEPRAQLDLRRFNISLILASLAINILSLALPILSLQIYDRILVAQNYATLHVMVVGVIIAIIIEAGLRLMRGYLVNWVGAVYEHIISCNAMRHTLNADLSRIEEVDVSEHMQRMASVGKLRDFTSGQAVTALVDFPFAIIYLTLIAYLAGWLVLAPIMVAGIFMLAAIIQGMKIQKTLKMREHADEKRFGFIIQTLKAINTTKSFSAEKNFLRQYENLQDDSDLANYFIAKQTAKFNCDGIIFNQIMVVVVVGVGAPAVEAGSLTMGTLVACVLLAGRMMAPIQKAMNHWVRLQDAKVAIDSIEQIFEIPLVDRPQFAKDPEHLGSLQLEQLSFKYKDQAAFMLNSVNLSLKRGDCIAISGEHISGKTTLLKLMAGLYRPDGGRVLIDGEEASNYPPMLLGAHIGYLAMDGVIFKGTIWDNLSNFGKTSRKNLLEIIRMLDIEKEISRLPEGMDTEIEGSAADLIPPGLKQRITIARALAQKPRIILFDNADRGLDKDGYNELNKLLTRLKGKATLVIVSDDKNILQLADREYSLADGQLIEKRENRGSKAFNVKPHSRLAI